MTSPDPEQIARRLAASLDRGHGDGITHQIVSTIWQDVIEGMLDTGARMPTARHLAVELHLSPRVISRAYERLEDLGVLTSRAGEGTFVSLAPADPEHRERWKKLERLCQDTVAHADTLGFSLDELIDALADLRTND